MTNDLSSFDPQWIAQLKNSRKSEENLALSSTRTNH
jgi:alginate O-acetyltransferase complex protein AlgJ